MRIRTIKPSFFKDEKLAELPPLTRLLFIGLWGLADSEGRLEYRPKYIKVEVLPYDDVEIPKMLADLDQNGFIQIYSVPEKSKKCCINVARFKKHQRISGKEAEIKSEYPKPPMREAIGKQRGSNGEAIGKEKVFPKGSNREATGKQSGSNREAVIVQEGKGREGKGRERKKDTGTKNVPETPSNNVANVVTSPSTPQADFVERFKVSYEAMTHQAFKADKHHYVIASKLIKDHGYDAAVNKAKILGTLCRDRSAWFTKAGWADYTIEKLSSQWNSILTAEAPADKRDQDLIAEMKKQEVLSAIAHGQSD